MFVVGRLALFQSRGMELQWRYPSFRMSLVSMSSVRLISWATSMTFTLVCKCQMQCMILVVPCLIHRATSVVMQV